MRIKDHTERFNLQIGVGWGFIYNISFNLHGGYTYFSTEK